jgi:MoxR-like ATPase
MNEKAEQQVTETVLRQKKLQDDSDVSIPEKFEGFVPFGFYKDLTKIVDSKQFFPVFITGMSGNGKTLMVEQVCATAKRECIRVNISVETDETDLIGSNTLVDGNVVYRDGPVITAMKRGAILLIDEVDRGSNKLMCLQGILEGKPYFNKKSGEYVHPKEGFNVVATANTKGFGSEDGKFLAQILDSAFLERFCITVEQEYPDPIEDY